MVIGWERGNESMEGPAILAYSAGLSPLVCRLFFPPLLVLELLITSLSPLHCIPHSFVILPRKRIREPSLSHHTFPLSHFAFLCLASARSPACTLRSQHTSPQHPPHHRCYHHHHHHRRRHPAAYDVTPGARGCWEVTRGRTSSCPASISAV